MGAVSMRVWRDVYESGFDSEIISVQGLTAFLVRVADQLQIRMRLSR